MQVVLPICWFCFIYLRLYRTHSTFLKPCFLFPWDCPFFAINIFNRTKDNCRANSNCKQDKQWSNLIHWYWFQGICSIWSVISLGHIILLHFIFVDVSIIFRDLTSTKWKYRLLHQKRDKSKSKNFINGKFKKWFYFLTCISPDYVSHESSKEFWKNSHYWNMRDGFLRGVKKHFGKIALKWCIFRHEKNEFLINIML